MPKNNQYEKLSSYPIFGGTTHKKQEVKARIELDKASRELREIRREKDQALQFAEKAMGSHISIINQNSSSVQNSAENCNSSSSSPTITSNANPVNSSSSNTQNGSGLAGALLSISGSLVLKFIMHLIQNKKA